jgi:hypothetical protein
LAAAIDFLGFRPELGSFRYKLYGQTLALAVNDKVLLVIVPRFASVGGCDGGEATGQVGVLNGEVCHVS